MTQPVDFPIQADAGNSDREIGKVTSAFKELARAIEAINKLDLGGIARMADNARSPLDQMKRDMSALSSTAKQEGRKLGKSMAEGMAQGMAEAGETVRAAEKRKWQNWYDQQLAMNAKFKDRVGTLARLQAGGISLSPTDKEYLKQQREMLSAQTVLTREAEKNRKTRQAAEARSEVDHLKKLAAVQRSMEKAKATAEADQLKALNDRLSVLRKERLAAEAADAKRLIAVQQSMDKAQAEAQASLLVSLKNQSKAMWTDLAQAEARDLEAAKQSKAAMLRSLKNQSKAMWAEVAQAEREGVAAMKKATAEAAAAAAAAQAQIAAMAARPRAAGTTGLGLLGPTSTGPGVGLNLGANTNSQSNYATGRRAVVTDAFGMIIPQAKAAEAALQTSAKAAVELGEAHARSGPHLAKTVTTLNDMHSAARGVASGFNAMWLTWGSLVPLLAGAAVSNAFVQTVKQGAALNDTFERLRVLGGESAQAVAGLNTQMLELARSGPIGPQEIAEAMKTLRLAGLDATEVGASIKDVLNFSIAGDTSLTQAAEAITTIGTAFNIAAADYSYISDTVAKAAAESKASIESMSEAMKTASVVHQQYGVSLEDTAVGLSLLANAGIQGSAAGTALRNMYVDLAGRTDKVSAKLKQLGVEALDPVTGKMRSQAEIFRQLISGLQKYETAAGATKTLQDIFSERSAKQAIALYNAMTSAAKKAGSDASTAYDDLLEKVTNAGGTSALAAAELALTPLRQMESVKSTLQSTLVEVFNSLQPYILQFATDLKALFNSAEFKGTLQELVVGVGELTRFLFEHGKAIAYVVIGYQGLKAVASLVTAMGTAYAAMSVQVAAGTTAMGLAARAATLANPLMLALAAVVSAAASAWALYTMWAGKGAQATSPAVQDRDALIKNLEAEHKRLREINTARERGIDLSEYLASKQAKAVVSGDSEDVVKARAALKDAENFAASRIKGTGAATAAQKQVNDAQAALTRALEVQAAKDRAIASLQAGIRDFGNTTGRTERYKAEADALSKAGLFNGTGLPDDGTGGGGKGARAKALALQLDNELAQISKRYNDELQMVSKLQTNEQNLLRASFDAKLVDSGAFYARELQLATKAEADKLRLTDKAEADYTAKMLERIADAQAQYEKAVQAAKGKKGAAEAEAQSFEVLQQALRNLGNEAETVFQGFANTRREVSDGADTRIALQAIKARGELKALDEASKEFWLGEALRTQAAARSTAVDDALRYASPEQAAYIQAAASENERLQAVMLDLQKQYDLARTALNGYTNEMLNSEVITEEMKQGERDRIEVLKRLKAEMDKVAGSAGGMADEAGMRAFTKFRKDEEAALNRGVSDAIVTGLMEGGEAGKGRLRNLVVEELRKPITMVVQAIVNPVMGALMGGLGLSSTASAAGQAGGSLLGSAASSLGSSALSTSLFGPGGVSGFAASVGEGVAATLSGTSGVPLASAGSTAFNAGAALPYVGAALLALNALGVFRSKKIVGGGLMGTLGEGDIQSYDLQRRGGTLFSGPKYSVVNQQRSQFSDMIQSDWKRATAAVVTMAESLGLATDAAKGFTATLGTDVIHPDTGGMGINLDDLRGKNLTPEQYNAEVRNRINEAIMSGSEELAQKLIGSWKTTTETIKKTVSTGLGNWDDGYTQSMVEVEEQVTRTEYVVSEYARSNETALETLTRLATSLTTVNSAFDQLGWNVQLSGLAGASAASDFADLFGGVDEFSSVMSQYYEAYYTDAERAANATRMVGDAFARIGVEAPTTLAGLRTMIEAEKDLLKDGDSSTGSTQRLADLLKLSAPLAEADKLRVQAAEKAAEDAKKAADSANQLVEKYQQITDKLSDDGLSAKIELYRALGMNEEAIYLERQKAVEGMDLYQQSLYDLNQYYKLQTKLITEKNDLEGQWAVLMGDTNFARDKELAALEPSNRALQQRIWALEDERAALEEFYSAADGAVDVLLGYADSLTFKYARQAQSLSNVGIGTGNVLADAQTLASLTPQQIRSMAVSFVQVHGAAHKATPVVLEVASALLDLASAANPMVEAFTGAADRLLQGGALSTFKVYSSVIEALNSAGMSTSNAAALTDALGRMSSDELRQAAFSFLAAEENSVEAKAAVIKLADSLITMRDAALEAKKAAEEQVRSAYKAITDALKAEEDKIIAGFVGAQNVIIDGVIEAQTNVNNLIKESATNLRSFAESIEDFIDSINNSDLSGADKITQYAQAQSQFAILRAQALAGDEKAQGKLTDSAQRVLELGRGSAATAVDYRRIVAQIKNSLQEVADSARNQADALDPNPSTATPLEAAQAELVKWQQLADKYNISDEAIQRKLADTQDKLLTANVNMEQWTRLTSDAAISAERIAQAQLSAVQAARAEWLKAADLKAEADRIIGAAGLGAVVTAITTNPQIAALNTAITEYDKAVAALNINVSNLGLAVGGVGTSLVNTLQPLVTAINSLATAIANMRMTNGGVQNPVTAPGPVTGPTTGTPYPMPGGSVTAKYGAPVVDNMVNYIQSVASSGSESAYAAGVNSLIASAQAQGITSADLAAMVSQAGFAGISQSDINDWAAANGLPRFARGGFHAGGLRIVGENGPELEATGAARIWNADQTRNMLSGSSEKDDEIVEVLEEVRDLLVAIGYETRATAGHTNKAARILDRVTKDGEAITTTPLV